MSNDLASRSLAYHANPKPGKLNILPSKPCTTQDDLSLAYTPGVAVPCTEIHDHPEKIWDYTGRGNTVAVVSDGTAVLGLGNIGPEAGLPVMEGKSVLFKRFADIDAVALCIGGVFKDDGRTDLNPQKQRFAAHTDARTLADAIKGADVFVGVSVPKALTGDMVRTMAPGAVVFAMANPTPEIFPDEALAAGAAVAGTGRSDYSNQVNNVLGFPGIFRGALDTRASDINEAMKLAASRALADIVAEPMPEDIRRILSAAYPEEAAKGIFEGEIPLKASFVIPKPFDPRVVPRVARMVAEAAMASGVAQVRIDDLDAYERAVAERIARNAAQ